MYKKKFLYKDILNQDLFMKLAPIADDIWFWAMTVLNGTKIIIPTNAQKKLICVDMEMELTGETLWSKNITQNDIQFRQIIEKYPALLEKLIRETATLKPYLSIILPTKNLEAAQDCIRSMFYQNFPDFELIVVNFGNHFEISPLPTNFKIINYPSGSLEDALNLGLQKAQGEYLLFADQNSLFFVSSLEFVVQTINDSKADVIHFLRRIRLSDHKIFLDDKLNFDKDTPLFLDESRQNRATLWLQDNLSRRIDTKIFKREFLTRHKINFDRDIAEFMFQALISAEKYLLVPQAFCFCKE